MNRTSVLKYNKRGFPLIRFVALLVCCFFIARNVLHWYSHRTNSIEKSELQIQDVSAPEDNDLALPVVLVSPPKNILTYIVKPGDSFYSIFPKYGISDIPFDRIYSSLRHLGFSALYPKDSIIFCKNDSNLLSIDYYNRTHEKYSVHFIDSAIEIKKQDIPVTLYRYLLKGRLQSSLSESMFAYGVGDAIATAITDIFAWDINFFIDPREGDEYSVLFEKKVIGGKSAGYGSILAAKYRPVNGREFSAYQFSEDGKKAFYFDGEGNALQKQFLKAPLSYSRISSKFTYKRKHPILGIVRPHLGIDYAAPAGTPVYASADGKIFFAGYKQDYGKTIILSHGGMYQTYYGHLQSFASTIKTGRFIRQGEMIGKVGSTGLSTGPHLDYRMKREQTFVNPLTIVCPSLESVLDVNRVEFSALVQENNHNMEQRFTNKNGCFLVEIEHPEEKAEQKAVVLVK